MKLTNYQYDRLLQQYDERRMKARFERDKKTRDIYNIIPRIKELDELMASESVNAGISTLNGVKDAMSGLQETIDRLVREKAELLKSYGYPSDYLDETYVCSKCRDTGFIGNEQCGCFKTAMAELVLEESNLKDIIDKENFSSFRTDLYSNEEKDYDKDLQCTPYGNICRVLKKAKAFTADFDEHPGNLLIYGNTGLGKTFLTNCIAGDILRSGHTVLYYTTFSLFDMLSKYTFKYEDYPKETFVYREGLLTSELLIIDDLGTELSSSFTTEQLYSIINERLLNKLSTVISTNLTPSQISARYGERIFSRLGKDYDFIKLIGQDIRTAL